MSCAPAMYDVAADYVDNLLDLHSEAEFERHLVACQACRSEVDAQRALIARMRAVPVDRCRHDDLVAGLLQLDQTPAGAACAGPLSARSGPSTVDRTAPPQYVSARRSLACAAFAAAGCLGVAITAGSVPTQGNGSLLPAIERPPAAQMMSGRSNGTLTLMQTPPGPRIHQIVIPSHP